MARGRRQHQRQQYGVRGGDPESNLKAWLDWKSFRAINRPESDTSYERTQLLKRWRGDPYGTERKGFSKITTREVFEAIEWAVPELVRVFLGGDRVIHFDETQGDDENQVLIENHTVHQALFGKTEHYLALRLTIADALLYPCAYACLTWDDEPVTERRTFTGISEDQVELLAESDEVHTLVVEEVMEHTDPNVVDTTGYPVVQRYMSGYAEVIVENGSLCLEEWEPEDVRVSNYHRRLSLDDCEFVELRKRVSISELIEHHNIPREVAEKLSDSHYTLDTYEDTSRMQSEVERDRMYSSDKGAQRKVHARFIWCHYDLDDDGISESRYILMVGDQILENEECSYRPVLTFSYRPLAHSHIGYSMGQATVDLQDQNTVSFRQLNDNMLRVNRPRQFHNTSVNVDELLDFVPGGAVGMADPHHDVVTENIPSVVNHVLPVLQHNRERAEARTGSAARGETLNADVLAKSTMGAYLEAVERGNSRLEQAARDMAETAFTQMALKAHELLRLHSGPRQVKIKGQWITVDPSQWRTRTAVSTNTGEGLANRRERFTANMTLLDLQEKAMQHGMAGPEHMYHTIEDILSLMGKANPNRYFFDPKSPEGAESMQKVAEAKRMEQERRDQVANAAVESQNREVDRRAIKDQKDASLRLLELRQKQSHHDDDVEIRQEEIEQRHDVDIAKWGAGGGSKAS